MSKVPTSLRVVLRNKIGYRSDYTNRTHKCRPAFVTDADSKKSLETAKTWAKGTRYTGPGATGKADPEVVEAKNTPSEGYRVIDLEERGEGGRAFKVITPEGWLVDMREDTFMPAILKRGLAPDGTIPGTFLWVRLGTQIRLVEKDSPLHKRVLKEQAKQDAKDSKVKLKELVIGGVYGGEVAGVNVYVGRLRHQGKLKYGWLRISGDSPKRRTSWQKEVDFALSSERMEKQWDGFGPLGARWKTVTVPQLPEIRLTGSHSYTETYGTVQIDIEALKDRPVEFCDGWGSGIGEAGSLPGPVEWA